MSVYQVTREGQNLGSFEAAQIQEGLQNGQFLPSDWGWREGMSGWKGLGEIFDGFSAPQNKPALSSLSALVRRSPASKPAENINPYAAPASHMAVSRTSGEIPSDVMLELKNTRPW
uniref:GYF domain-containing protein n=1 Tax=Prosthecobacter sp. TaxID=1965333 RepID=UPI003782FD44